MPQPKIRVFWDLNTCPPPDSYASPWELLNDFRLFTSHFGTVTSIKAYWDRNTLQNATADVASEALRAAMPAMGVSLVDCSLTQGYTTDALTRTLTVDVLISVIDDPATSTPTGDIVMILSGDESILYPISLLMFRNYTIFLVVPDEKKRVQAFQATRVFDWCKDVLGAKPEEPIPAPETTQSRAWIVYGKRVPQRPVTSDPTLAATPRSSSRSLPSPESSLPSRAPSALSSLPDKAASKGPHVGDVAADLNVDVSGHRARGFSQIYPPEPEGHTRSDPGTRGGWNANGIWTAGGWKVDVDGDSLLPGSNARETGKPIVRGPKDVSSSQQSEWDPDEVELSPEHDRESLNEVPFAAFEPLLQILRESKRRSMGRSKLGEEMARHKRVYREAGVKGFAEYIALAVTKELVIAGGVDNNSYVRLHPKLKKERL